MDREQPMVLCVDDDPGNLDVLRALFEAAYDVRTAPSGPVALEVLAAEPVAVLLTDQRMPGMTGNRLIEEVTARWPEVVAIVVTAYSDTEPILGAIRAGRVHDYVVKPWSPDDLRRAIAGAAEEHRRRRRAGEEARDRLALQEEVLHRYDPSQMVGADEGLREVMAVVRMAAPTDSTVLLAGETGSGKEMLARAVHAGSPRSRRALVKVDCAAMAPTLVESDLFGHERGAFTGAVSDRRGKFELADGGTIFLDEVGELSVEMQAKLLRALQERVVERLGGTRPTRVDVRVIAATSRDLPAAVANGSFREDLYYRLCVVPIFLPPLRARTGDIPSLVRHFLAKHGRQSTRYEVAGDAIALLKSHRWPGNVRELENLVERALVLGAGPVLGTADLSPVTTWTRTARGTPVAEEARQVIRGREAARIRDAVGRAGGNLAAAARLLGVPRTTLVHRIRKLGI